MNQNLFTSALFLDIGNSKAKLVGFDSTWKQLDELPKSEYASLFNWLESFSSNYSTLIWTSVVDVLLNKPFEPQFKHVFKISRDQLPLDKVNYSTPHTLGLDRYLACLGAWSESKKAVVVIDAGTALTIDLMDEKGVFQGGIITPGLYLWEKSLREHAPALPKVEREIPIIWPPKSTSEALKWGISGGFIELCLGFIDKWKIQFPDAQIWCTGGDGEWVSVQMDNAKYDAFLVQKGMKQFFD